MQPQPLWPVTLQGEVLGTGTTMTATMKTVRMEAVRATAVSAGMGKVVGVQEAQDKRWGKGMGPQGYVLQATV